MVRIIFLGWGSICPRGRMAKAPSIVTGRIGTSSSEAMTNAPFLKRVISPVRVRLPSGKIKIELPVASTRFASEMVLAMEEGFVSSTKM